MTADNQPSHISRRDFLRTAAAATGAYLPDWILKLPEGEQPLNRLPVFRTQNTPMHIEHLTRGGQRMDTTQPGYEMYASDLVTVSGIPFDIKGPLYIDKNLSVDGNIAWVADLPHVTGLHPIIPRLIIGWGDEKQIQRSNGHIEWKSEKDTVSTYAFSDKLRIYPSKIYNILTALACIAQWQIDNGPMTAANTYSYLIMSGAPDRNKDQYLKGGQLDAGGICASVSTMSKCLFIAQSLGNLEITKRTLHKPTIQYAENHGDPAITKANSDATVGWGVGKPADNPYNADLQWRLAQKSPKLYLSFSASIKMDDKPVDANIPRRHTVQPADARLTFGINLQTKMPDHEMEINLLHSIRDRYAKFHNFNDGREGGFGDT
jgi:hypothetical protein